MYSVAEGERRSVAQMLLKYGKDCAFLRNIAKATLDNEFLSQIRNKDSGRLKHRYPRLNRYTTA